LAVAPPGNPPDAPGDRVSEADADSPADTAAPGATARSGAGYRVLARKYRPADFSQLIGQDAMVRTLTNAFAGGRIAQAYMLTGVRGVGKTTTARILARALNYEAPGVSGPTIDIAEPGAHCAAIMESRHPDVFEMDAASNTGIDDVREIIGYAQTRPSMARYKVFIIDEVHMLSRQAFNGLLKTLEEPPEHVRFIFATTEVRKVPVTVLSRCQRFDLRRVGMDLLIDHFGRIATEERCQVEPEAVALIARAAEGSVRDGLSLLDQAIALGGSEVRALDVRAMLGLADRSRVIDLFGQVMTGDVASALEEFAAQYAAGADPQVMIADLAEFVHLVTRVKVTGAALADPSLTEVERERARDFAGELTMASLARAWQMLLKGHQEIETARHALSAAEMVVIRLAYASSLPPPAEVIRSLGDDGGDVRPEDSVDRSAAAPNGADGAAPAAEPGEAAASPESFDDAVRLVCDIDIRLADPLEQSVRPVSFAAGHIEIEVADGAPRDIANRFAATMNRATGARWVVSIAGAGRPPPPRQAEAFAAAVEPDLVASVMRRFPGARVVDQRELPPADDAGGAERGGDTIRAASSGPRSQTEGSR
jgi:DNA polymerase-3 subunit gamma/tau